MYVLGLLYCTVLYDRSPDPGGRQTHPALVQPGESFFRNAWFFRSVDAQA